MLPPTSIAHIHLYFIHSSFSPSFPHSWGWRWAGEKLGVEWLKLDAGGEPCLPGGRKPLRCHHQGLCKQNAWFSLLSFAALGGWECLVFHGESNQGTEDLASKLKQWHGATFTY